MFVPSSPVYPLPNPTPVVPLVHVESLNAEVSHPGIAADGTLNFVAAPVLSTVVLTTGVPYDTFVFCAGNGSNADSAVTPSGAYSPRYSPSFASAKFVC